MEKETCGEYGNFGYADGYFHPQKLCKMGECPDANDCSNKMKEELNGANYLMRIFRNKELGLKVREEEKKAKEFEEKEKVRLATEKMNADKKAKEDKDAADTKAAEDKKVADEKAAADKLVADAKVKLDKEESDKKTNEEKQKKLDEEQETAVAKVEVFAHTCPHCKETIKEGEVYTEDEGKTIRHNTCKGKVKLAKEPIKEEPKKEEKPVEGPENKPELGPDGKPVEKKPEEEKK